MKYDRILCLFVYNSQFFTNFFLLVLEIQIKIRAQIRYGNERAMRRIPSRIDPMNSLEIVSNFSNRNVFDRGGVDTRKIRGHDKTRDWKSIRAVVATKGPISFR